MKWTDLLGPIIVLGLIVYEYIMSHRQYEEECENVKKGLEKEYAEKNAECEAAKEDINKMIADLSQYRLEQLTSDYKLLNELHGSEIHIWLNGGYSAYVEVKVKFRKWFRADPKGRTRQEREGYDDEHVYEIHCSKGCYGTLDKDIIKLIQDKYDELEKEYREKAEGK